VAVKIESLPQGQQLRVTESTVYSYPPHIHTYCEMIYYEPFSGTVTVNGRCMEARHSFALLMAPMDLHSIQVDGGSGRFVKVELRQVQVEHSTVVEHIPPDGLLRHVFDALGSCRGDGQLLRLLTETAMHLIQTQGEKIAPLSSCPANALAVEAAKLLHSGFQKSLSLTSVAQTLFVSPQYLSLVFKQTMGVGFCQYLSRLRMEHAAKLLAQTEKPVTQVCFEAGFGNLSHFIRRFQHIYGCSPSAYRQEHL
jgi:AraC-like DNA-binding protein